MIDPNALADMLAVGTAGADDGRLQEELEGLEKEQKIQESENSLTDAEKLAAKRERLLVEREALTQQNNKNKEGSKANNKKLKWYVG